MKVLADTIGKLLVDGYSGFNKVALPGSRERAGCLAHPRRKFFGAQSAAPEAAKRAMDFILEVYKIERAALDNDLSAVYAWRAPPARGGARNADPILTPSWRANPLM